MDDPQTSIVWRVVKKEFPDQYHLLVEQLVQIAQQGGGKAQEELISEAEQATLSWLLNFTQANVHLVGYAQQDKLLDFISAQEATINSLSKYHSAECAAMAMGRAVDLTGKKSTLKTQFSLQNAAMFEAISAGIHDPQEYPIPNDDDWLALGDAIRVDGAEERLLKLLDDPVALEGATEEDQCAAGVHFLGGLNSLPDDQAARLASAMQLGE